MQVETERLTLRQFRESDLDDYAEMCADPEVMRYLGQGRPLTRAEAWRHIAMILGHWQLRNFGMWAIVERSTGAFAGRVGCWRPEGWPGVEIGWALRRPFWGRGIAIEGARASLKFAFETLNEYSVVHLVESENIPSIRVAERLGAYRDGYFNIFDSRVILYRIDRVTRRVTPNMSLPGIK